MTFDRIVLELMPQAITITIRDQRFWLIDGAGIVVVGERVGKGPRWSFGPSDVHRASALPAFISREARTWIERARRMNFAAHAAAMAARTV